MVGSQADPASWGKGVRLRRADARPGHSRAGDRLPLRRQEDRHAHNRWPRAGVSHATLQLQLLQLLELDFPCCTERLDPLLDEGQ